PIGRNCPKSGDYLVEKKVRGGGKQVICSKEECDYKESDLCVEEKARGQKLGEKLYQFALDICFNGNPSFVIR
ncbi:hypothetical protein L7U65_26520, partial [Klebsiella pneumoniae]|nr:hypothetical protein [Klebsiella pneumoniae]